MLMCHLVCRDSPDSSASAPRRLSECIMLYVSPTLGAGGALSHVDVLYMTAAKRERERGGGSAKCQYAINMQCGMCHIRGRDNVTYL